MTIIKTVPPGEASGVTAAFYAEDIRDLGYVASHTKVMSLHPEAYKAWNCMVEAVAGPMDKRRYELVTLAASLGIGSQHCRLAHGARTLKYFDEATLIRIARDYRNAGLTAAEVAMMEFAEKLSRDSASMTEQDSRNLQALGFSDEDIVEITLAAAMRNFFARAVQALAVDVDSPPALSAGLKQALLDPLTCY
ncbi:putative peroxidase-related enzyme [Arthrobacter sp. B3I9]|uniref:carboxymuconolactone decarboxylase family protein n=1 Tax=Arthrobacter sp. B3I9 TaxID=3042270 RepID=UPI0027928C4C|nr:carboxymuconolactone decarboxylase family protein [Arthrobacter sp. B3I9]MDQ0850846.1 putative peroxidase-related enzyme [Arthrobacter sp. B3I9]